MSAAITFLTELAAKLQTQDNVMTASPNYCIQEHVLVTGIDADYGGEIGWFDHDGGSMAESRKHRALEKYYYKYDKEPEGWTRCGYSYEWEYIGANFLTYDAAKECVTILKRKGRSSEYRVYVDSHYRNHEMREVRRLLAGPVQECIAALQMAAEINPFGSVENANARDAAITALAALDTATEPQR